MVDKVRELVRLTRADLVRLLREGKAAAGKGVSPLDCPYSPNGDATERMRVAAWMRGHTRGSR